jgi:hypothetical protein
MTKPEFVLLVLSLGLNPEEKGLSFELRDNEVKSRMEYGTW